MGLVGIILFLKIWYVHPDSTLNRIRTALDSCRSGDTVLVAAGTYYENIRWPSTAGIKLWSESGPDSTIIDGSNNGSVIEITTGVDTATVISGFTIQWGYNDDGGGIFCDSSSPQIVNNIIQDNTARYLLYFGNGGGIYCRRSSPIIKDNIIMRNSAGDNGGGIYCRENSAPIIIGNRIEYNTAENTRGGGISCNYSSPFIKENVISGNKGLIAGGISCQGSSPMIDSCTISYNTGGGVYCDEGSQPELHFCDIYGNFYYGVENVDSTVIINAEYNWWGDKTGPYHPETNPNGRGDPVSDWVDYEPWLGSQVELGDWRLKRVSSHPAWLIHGPGVVISLPPGCNQAFLYDAAGRVMGRITAITKFRLSPGCYFLLLISPKERWVEKLVVIE